MSNEPTLDERTQAQKETAAFTEGQSAAIQMAAQQEEQIYKNEKFLAELRDSGLGPDAKHDLGAELAGAHVTAFRDPDNYERQLRWLTENKDERDIVQWSPGLHIKERPTCMAIAQDRHQREDRSWEEWLPAMDSGERAERRRQGDAVVNFKSLAIGGKGIDTVGTVQTSTEVTKSTDEERSIRERLEAAYR